MGYTTVRNNFFIYGETGERLAGIRESDIYKNSARMIRNLVLTELGNLKFAKQFTRDDLNLTNVRKVIDTRHKFYVVATDHYIYTVDKKTNDQLYYLKITGEITDAVNVKMFDDYIMVCTPTPQVVKIDPTTGKIGTTNYLSLLKYPILEKEEVKLDVYKVYEVKNNDKTELRVVMLSKYTNPKLESKGGNIYLYDTGLRVNRVYKQYKSSLDVDDITNPKKGEIYGVLYRYMRNENDKTYILGNEKTSFGGEQSDGKYGSGYFTKMNTNGSGELNYGKLQELKNNFIDIGVISDRLCIIKGNTFYFSKKDNYFDFRNGVAADDPFYFKPTPIANQVPNILRMHVGNNAYITTDKGVYVISYKRVLTPTSYSVFIASETPCSLHSELVNDNFYYLTPRGALKCTQAVPSEVGYESYQTFDAEKYDVRLTMNYLTKLTLDSRTVLVVGNYNSDVIYLYDSLEYNTFRRTSLDLVSGKLYGYKENLITTTGTMLIKSDKNYRTGILALNPPYLQSGKGGSYSNDYSSQIVRTFMKLLNEDRQAVKGVYLIDQDMPLDSKGTDDRFSTYKYENSTTVGNGYTVRIISNENNKVLEILGIENKIKVASD